jgi:hypothetical protein
MTPSATFEIHRYLVECVKFTVSKKVQFTLITMLSPGRMRLQESGIFLMETSLYSESLPST